MQKVKVKLLGCSGYGDDAIVGKIFDATIDSDDIIEILGKDINKFSSHDDWDDSFCYCFLNQEVEIISNDQ